MKRLLCLVGWHRWKYTLLFIEQRDYDQPSGLHYGSENFSGECERCGKRDLFARRL